MSTGERAVLKVSPQYGYGLAGSFSFPFVPPNANLEYETELLGFEDVDEVCMWILMHD